MKKEALILIILFSLLLSTTLISAISFSDFWNKITGKATSEDCSQLGGYCSASYCPDGYEWKTGTNCPVYCCVPPGTDSSETPSESHTYSWYVGSWKACSVECGGGTQTRDVYCDRSE